MPLIKDNGDNIALFKEMTESDFEWKPGAWFYASFTSPHYLKDEWDDVHKKALAITLNAEMMGPFHLIVTSIPGMARMNASIVVLHPDDRAFCDKILKQDKWRPIGNERAMFSMNVDILNRQLRDEYEYEMPEMNLLLREARKILAPRAP